MTEPNENAITLKAFRDALDEADRVTLRGKSSGNEFHMLSEDVDALKAAIDNRMENLYHKAQYVLKPGEKRSLNRTRDPIAAPEPVGPVGRLVFWSIACAVFAGFMYSVISVSQQWAASLPHGH